jgi:hypothetical protein
LGNHDSWLDPIMIFHGLYLDLTMKSMGIFPWGFRTKSWFSWLEHTGKSLRRNLKDGLRWLYGCPIWKCSTWVVPKSSKSIVVVQGKWWLSMWFCCSLFSDKANGILMHWSSVNGVSV